MSQQFSWSKTIIISLIFSLIVASLMIQPTAVSANETEERAATPFSDVVSGHWAEKHIAKLALQEIVKGTGVGKFEPSKSVTREDAVIMAVRFKGKENEVKTDDAVIFPESFKFSGYAKGYIVYAFENGLLDRLEEFESADENPAVEWGKTPASREWVTKLMIRALEEQQLAEQLASVTANFSDRDQIGSDYRGFVNAAVSLKLMQGVSADRFDPKGIVNRAMMATLLSNAQGSYPLASPNQAFGLISNVTENSISLYDIESEQESTYQLAADSLYYRYDSAAPIAADALIAYAEAMVIISGNTVKYVEQLADEPMMRTINGTIARVIADKQMIWLSPEDDEDNIIDVYYNSSLVIRDASGALLQISDLKVDSIVQVQQDTFRKEPLALVIQVQGAPVNKTGEALIKSISGNAITLEEIETAETKTWSLSSLALITWNDRVQAFENVQVGDTVNYEITNSLITKLAITSSSGMTINGEFNAVAPDGKTITYFVNNTPEVKFVALNVSIAIEGLNQPQISDLIKGDQLQMTVNNQNTVTAIKVLNRQVEIMNGAAVVLYEADSKWLTVSDTANKRHSIELTNSTRFEMNGLQVPLATAASMLTKDRKITIGYTDDKVVFLEFVNAYTGKVMALNTTAATLTLQLTNGSTTTIGISTPGVELYGKTTAVLADVKVGDTVTAQLGGTQERVILIQIHRTMQEEVVAVTTATNKIKLKSAGGTTVEYTVAANWSLQAENGSSMTIADFKPGQTVNVLYVGKQPRSLKVINIVRGKVAAVHADRVSVTEPNGSITDVVLGNDFKVVKGTAAHTSTAALAIGEWVDIRKNAEDTMTVTAIAGVSRKFRTYDAATNELFVLSTGASDTNVRYAVAADTKVTVAGAAASMQSLRNGDTIILYIIDGKLLEVVKQ